MERLVERWLIERCRGIEYLSAYRGHTRGTRHIALWIPGQIQRLETPAVLQKVVVACEADNKKRAPSIYGVTIPGLHWPCSGKCSCPPHILLHLPSPGD